MTRRARPIRRALSTAAVATLLATASLAATSQPVVAGDLLVFAAASLKSAFDEIASTWRKVTGGTLRISYAGTPALARQIEQGAPADVFVSADRKWMDVLAAAGHVDAASRRDLLTNSIVLIAHGKDAKPVEIATGFDLAGLLGDGRLAMAMVDSVPAGVYGKASLTALGVWDSVAGKIAQAENVRAALALVARGEAPFGIVYATDAVAADNVTVVGRLPLGSHPPIVYPAAVTTTSQDRASALAFLEFLSSATAAQVFERHGFKVVAPAGTD
ncbi:MAG: molybdate ABC transporter substrate-binding protein [Hyphomicrobiaceae bacterium]|nr:molybdate ABC transporter substrate-binding protein [Hyphomicrobiaceae bacterium]